MPCECHDNDADHEIALSNTNMLNALRGLAQYAPPSDQALENLRGFIREVFSLPGVQQAVYDVEANQMADTIEAMIEEGIAL